MSLRNISNFFNIIKKGRLKSQLGDTDMIPVGTRDTVNKSQYQDTAISFKDLKNQVGGSAPQGPPGATGPAGAQGPQGIQGVPGAVGAAGLNFTGTWDPTTAYAQDDVAFFDGSSYVATSAVGPTATDPSVDTANWAFLALQGLQGPQGVPGSGFSISDASRVDTGASTSQFLFRSLLIPANTFTLGDMFHIEAMFLKVTGHSFDYKCYINTANTLTGADLLWQTNFQSSRRYMNTVYTLAIDRSGPGDTTTGGSSNNNAVTSGFSQYGNSGSNHAIDWSVDQYILIGGVNSSAVNPTTNIGAKIW